MLSQRGIATEDRDFFKDPFTEAELRALLGSRAPSEVFSWKSPSFKALGLDAASLGDDDLVRLMLQEPRLIRRPMFQVGDDLVVGADKKVMEKVLG